MEAIIGLQIFTQADDLRFMISESGGKHAILVSRGPKHHFKPLLSTEPDYETRDAAVDDVMKTLNFICRKATEVLGDPHNILTSIENPNNLPVEQMKNVLRADHLRQIEEALRASGVANTYEMTFAEGEV